MPDRTPLRLVLDELGNPTGLAEFREGDTLPIGFVSGLGVELSTIDALLQVLVQTVGENTPPAGVEGQRFIVGTTPTGAWAGQANKLARFLDGAWQFFDARYVLNAANGLWYVRSASTWAPLAGGGGGEANTASNLGVGEGLYASKVGVELRFKSLVEGTNVTLTSDGDTVTINAAGGSGGPGTVTSVALSAPTGFAVSGSPVTTTGTLALAFDTGYSLPADLAQADWNTAFGWGDHATAGYEKELTAGANITIDRTNPDNPVISASASSGMTNPMTTAGDMIVGGVSGAPTRVGVGADTHVWTLIGGVPGWAAPSGGGGGGLTNFTETKTTAAPNATTPAVSLSVAITETNGDIAIVPKGNGAVIAAIPNNSASAGNKRGTNAVDLQTVRSAATQVASGSSSCVVGGSGNTASANFATVVGGESNVASGVQSVAAGGSNTASGSSSVAMGDSNSATAAGAIAIGVTSVASAPNAVAIGNGCTANGADSTAVGRRSDPRGVLGAFAHASLNNIAQNRRVVLLSSPTNATPVTLTTDAGAASSTNQLNIPIRSTFFVTGRVSAHNQTSNDASIWVFEACLKSTTSGDVSFVGTPTVTLVAQDSGASDWDVSVEADSALKVIKVTAIGAASGMTRFSCVVDSVEVTT